MKEQPAYDIIIAGAGAAGFFAGISALEMRAGSRVLILEKSNKILSKVLVSGGGRCNVTNVCAEPAELVKNYPRGGRSLLNVFYSFGQKETVEWFRQHGVQLKAEEDGRMFPRSDSSETIAACLRETYVKLGGELQLQKDVTAFRHEDGLFSVSLRSGDTYRTARLIIASGGAPKTAMLDWIKEHGHEIRPSVPSLFTFNLPQDPICSLMGISVENAEIKIRDSKFRFSGPLLITHWGLSGPAILKLSAFAAEWIYEKNYSFSVEINWLHSKNRNTVSEELSKLFKNFRDKKVRNLKPAEIPGRLWEYFLNKCGVDPEKNGAEISSKELESIIKTLFADVYQVNGKTTFKEEFVTAGGVSLRGVDMRSMESKHIPGLFFCGEVLDVDGITGGFNFQAAWSTARAAAVHAINNL